MIKTYLNGGAVGRKHSRVSFGGNSTVFDGTEALRRKKIIAAGSGAVYRKKPCSGGSGVGILGGHGGIWNRANRLTQGNTSREKTYFGNTNG